MKKIALVVAACLYFIGTGFGQNQTTSQMKFTSTDYDFGQIKEVDGIVTHVFEFKNISDKPLVINFVSSSCGCTTPEYDKKPVMPGGSGKIKVAYDPAGRPGVFNKEIIIVSNNRQTEDILTIQGNVIPRPRTIDDDYPVKIGDGLRASSNSVSFGPVALGYSHSKNIYLYNQSEQDIQVATQGVSIPGISITTDPKILPPKGKGKITVTYDLTKVKEYNTLEESFLLSSNGKVYEYPIRVTAVTIPDFSGLSDEERRVAPHIDPSSTFHHFGTVQIGKKLEKTFEIGNIGGRDLSIEAIIAEDSSIHYSLDKKLIKPTESAHITLTMDTSDGIARMSKKVTIISNDLFDPVIELRMATNLH